MRYFLNYFFLTFLLLCTFGRSENVFAQVSQTSAKDGKGEAGTKPNYSINGSALLTSNYVEQGLTMSDGNPAFNGLFLVNLGSQFSFGFWGSNVSNLDSNSQNVWIKYIAEANVDFQSNFRATFYFQDHHFYTSSARNGQRFGARIKYMRFEGFVETQTNFEGTGTSAFYFQTQFTKKYTDKYGLTLAAGYTNQNSSQYSDYLDLKAEGFYQPIATIKSDLGITLPSNTNQFGSRSEPQYYLDVNLIF